MTRVTFYVLSQTTLGDRHNFACRLVEKAVNQGNRVMLATRGIEESQQMDKLLWSFRPESFVPHHVIGADLQSPVLISHSHDDTSHHDLLINLRAEIPSQFSRFNRLVEIVIQDAQDKARTREHYSFYKERGYPIETHSL